MKRIVWFPIIGSVRPDFSNHWKNRVEPPVQMTSGRAVLL